MLQLHIFAIIAISFSWFGKEVACNKNKKSEDYKCDAGYEYFSGRCYRVFEPATYETALSICRKDGGDLASVHDRQTDAYVASKGKKVIIGLQILSQNFTESFDKQPSLDGYETDRHYDSDMIKWSDASNVEYVNDAKKLSKWQPYFGKCVAVSKFHWENVECNATKLKFLCAKEVRQALAKWSCPQHFMFYNDFCYRRVKLEKSFDDAESYCLRLGGHLASVHSMEDANFIKGENTSKLWVGYKGDQWTDGSDSSFIRDLIDREEYPGLVAENVETCIVSRPWGGHTFVACINQKLPFVCQMSAAFETNKACPAINKFSGSAQISSPGYPRKYVADPLLTCNYYFASKSKNLATIKFDEVNLGSDYIIVYEGWKQELRYPLGLVTKKGTGPTTEFTTADSNLISLEFIGWHSGKWKAHLAAAQKAAHKQRESKEYDESSEGSGGKRLI